MVSACSAGDVAFLFVCLPDLSLLVSAVFHWPCGISIHLFPISAVFFCLRSVTAGVRPFLLAVAFLFMCLSGLSLLVSALFR